MRKEKIIMPTAIDVANHILAYAKEQQQPIGNLKLQYILFLLWKDYWNKTKTDLFQDVFCAWKFGPCVPVVYWEFCEWGGLPITDYFKQSQMDETQKADINYLLRDYLALSIPMLHKKTTKPFGAWSFTWLNGKGNLQVISRIAILDEIKTDKNRKEAVKMTNLEKLEKLARLIRENPDCSIYPMVASKVVGNEPDSHDRWLGEIGEAKVEKYIRKCGRIFFKTEADKKQVVGLLIGWGNCASLSDDEIKHEYETLPWKKAIFVDINQPD